MMIGAAALIEAWGRDMTYKRDGAVLFTFKGRRAEGRPEDEQLMESVGQNNFRIIALASAFGAVRPRKFDVITDEHGEDYTVQRGHFAGADVDELVKLNVQGGQV